MNEVYCFAYGSNLDISQMKQRVGDPLSSERAYAKGYKRVFNVWSEENWGGWAANLEKTDMSSDKVYGVVYLITKEQLDELTDKYERIPPSTVSVKLENGQVKNDVYTYIWSKKEPSHKPSKEYSSTIIKGLTQHGYSQDIIEQVQSSFFVS